MQDLRLEIKFEIFENELTKNLENISNLKGLSIETEEDLDDLADKSKLVFNEVERFLKKSFNVENNKFYRIFKHENNFRIRNIRGNSIQQRISVSQESKKLKERLQSKSDKIIGIIKCVSVADKIRNEEGFDLESRENYTISQIQTLLLTKLYELFDDNYYEVTPILVDNGIKIPRSGFDRDITKELEIGGLIEVLGAIGGVSVRLSGYGAKYVQEFIQKRIKLESEIKSINKIGKEESESLRSIKDEFKKLISNDELESILDKLTFFLKNNLTIYDDVTLISGRYYQLERKILRGIVSEEESNLERNRIRNAVLTIVNRLEENEINE
ncbi:MAG: hypothetical protein AAFO07_09485 [Bacteroidota bacterium]